MRPSCGLRDSAMSMPASTLMRTAAPASTTCALRAWRSVPSMRWRTRKKPASGSKCRSEALRDGLAMSQGRSTVRPHRPVGDPADGWTASYCSSCERWRQRVPPAARRIACGVGSGPSAKVQAGACRGHSANGSEWKAGRSRTLWKAGSESPDQHQRRGTMNGQRPDVRRAARCADFGRRSIRPACSQGLAGRCGRRWWQILAAAARQERADREDGWEETGIGGVGGAAAGCASEPVGDWPWRAGAARRGKFAGRGRGRVEEVVVGQAAGVFGPPRMPGSSISSGRRKISSSGGGTVVVAPLNNSPTTGRSPSSGMRPVSWSGGSSISPPSTAISPRRRSMDSISRVRICGTRLGCRRARGEVVLKPEMPEMVGRTLRVMSPSAEICGD